MNIKDIIKYLDNYLIKTGRKTIDPVEANAILAKAGILSDSNSRPGKPLRDLLRKGQLPHAFQSGGKGSSWSIPLSTTRPTNSSNFPSSPQPTNKSFSVKIKPKVLATIVNSELKEQLENARLYYKPDIVKYLLIAEAPPDSFQRFFYYDNVRQHDYLFLGVAQALYPIFKDKFISSGRSSDIKNSILLKLKSDGFYLIDLSELPLSLMTGDLSSQLPSLVEKINKVADENTKTILIKATVYDCAFHYLQGKGFGNVVDVRIPFPGQGGQKLFQTKFREALELVNFH